MNLRHPQGDKEIRYKELDKFEIFRGPPEVFLVQGLDMDSKVI